MRRFSGLGVLAIVLLTGCTGAALTPIGEVPPGSEAYQQGYVDGCLSGRRDAEPEYYKLSMRASKNPTRFENDEAYRGGWKEAYARCYEYAKNHPKKVK